MKIFLIICLAFCFYNFSFQKEPEIIYWSKHNALKWTDFKGSVDATNIHEAISTCDIYFKYKRIGDTLKLIVRCDFLVDKSWVKKDKETIYLLKHEQTHFDIVEIYARKLRQSYSLFKFNKNNYKSELNTQYQKINTEKLNCQVLYDSETDHSKIKAKQLEWEKKVAKELKDLEAYSNTEIKIMLK